MTWRDAARSRCHLVAGARSVLQAVWQSYGIDPGTMLLRSAQHRQPVASQNLATSNEPGNAALLAHTDAVYLIDPQGRERAFGRSDHDPASLAAALVVLTE